jgi:superfamily II DNA or RNA helicase
MLRERNWPLKLTQDSGDLVSTFYVPALSSAVRYWRTTGYFKAAALALAARGIEGLVLNEGKMRLIVGATLAQPEIDAIARGEAAKAVLAAKLAGALPPVGTSPDERQALELLAWLVAQGMLEIKVAVKCDKNRQPIAAEDAHGIFHQKTGIIEDKTGDSIAFSGSLNETVYGWRHNGETFSLFTSWRDPERVTEEEQDFSRLWADRSQSYCVMDVGEAVNAELMRYLPEEGELPARLAKVKAPIQPTTVEAEVAPASVDYDAERAAVWERIWNAARDPDGGDYFGEATAPVEPWPHQLNAFDRMYRNWPPKLLIADEVGLGKTIQAGLLIRQAWLAGKVRRAIILAPKNVCRQWQIELREKFNLDWPIYDGAKLLWYPTPARGGRVEQPISRTDWHKTPFVIMSSHLARRRERRPELLDAAEPWDLVVLDEAHHARAKRSMNGEKAEPNELMRLMRGLKEQTAGLLLLTATPLQTDTLDLYDLLSLLGLPAEWTPDAFSRHFADLAAEKLSDPILKRATAMFRSTERAWGEVERERAAAISGISAIATGKVLRALRDPSEIPRQMLDPTQREAARKIMQGSTPVRALVSRHTRELLRRYHREGRLQTRIAERQVDDRLLDLSPEEAALYERVENYISGVYRLADPAKRSAAGFVLTIYRRRLASSFYALRATLLGRRDRDLAAQAIEDDLLEREDEGEDIDAGDLAAANDESLEVLASERDDIISAIERLPPDTKANALATTLEELRSLGYQQVMVFTQYTDTMDYLRERLVAAGVGKLLCFSGRGGEALTGDGRWSPVSREDVKRRFREGQAEVLLCTDAAAEGLNFQFCGALVNFDLPWNPMRVEQRIGRIDRLGQAFKQVRIVNLLYRDTVETDVYLALRERIGLFRTMVGKLQPILASLPKLFEKQALSATPGASDAAIGAVDQLIQAAAADSLDLDLFAAGELDLAPLRRSPVDLDDLRRVLTGSRLLPDGCEASALGERDWRWGDGRLPADVRVTLDRGYFDQHIDSVEFWTPGSLTFPWQAPS